MNTRLFPLLTMSFLLSLVFLSMAALPSHAHRLRVYAYSSGREIVVTASFGHNRPAEKSKVTATSNNGTFLFQGRTDIRGLLRFPRPELAPNDKLVITVNGGPGHQGSWILTPEDLGTQHPLVSQEIKQPRPLESDNSAKSTFASEERQDLEKLVSEAVAREIEPLKVMMVRQMDTGPSLQNIIGGIGWLIGLGGLLAAWTSRKKK
jgi:nickel transport protein